MHILVERDSGEEELTLAERARRKIIIPLSTPPLVETESEPYQESLRYNYENGRAIGLIYTRPGEAHELRSKFRGTVPLDHDKIARVAIISGPYSLFPNVPGFKMEVGKMGEPFLRIWTCPKALYKAEIHLATSLWMFKSLAQEPSVRLGVPSLTDLSSYVEVISAALDRYPVFE